MEFEQTAIERFRSHCYDFPTAGFRRIGTSTQILVECLVDLIAYESSPDYPQYFGSEVQSRKEDDFVLVVGRGCHALPKLKEKAGHYYKKLGGRHPHIWFDNGPLNLWIIPWERKRLLRGVRLPNNRFFFDPCSMNYPVPHGPMRLIRRISLEPITKDRDGSWVYEALDHSGHRVALLTKKQAQHLCNLSLHPVKMGHFWTRPQGTYP